MHPEVIVDSVVSGHPITVVSSPPGGGKSTLLAQICATLATDYGLSHVIGTPTREQARGMAIKLLDVLPAGHVNLALSGMHAFDVDERFRTPLTKPGVGTVTIRTLDSLRMSNEVSPSRLLVVDEAFQASFILGASAARHFDQILAVGDPGQIGPVIMAPTEVWDDNPHGPHRPFAEVLASYPGAQRHTITTTYRLGARTTQVIAGLYDFNFTSSRPRTWLTLDGAMLPELTGIENIDATSAAVARALALRSAVVHAPDGPAPLTESDIAILTTLRAHAAMASAMLREAGAPGITVGTADSLQGGQWKAVVVIDPLSAETISDHHLSLGRLCVVLSRHSVHCTFVSAPSWNEYVDDLAEENAAHRVIRRTIMGYHD